MNASISTRALAYGIIGCEQDNIKRHDEENSGAA